MFVIVRVGGGVGCDEGDDDDGEDLALLTRQLAAVSTSEHSNSFHDNHGEVSVYEADSTSFISDGIGSSPPPPSPVNSQEEEVTDHSSFLSHPLSSVHCEMDDQPTSPSPSHFHHSSPQP